MPHTKLYPLGEGESNPDREVPVITADELRNFRNIDWTQYYNWFTEVGDPHPIIVLGRDCFNKAFAMAETMEQWRHLDKSFVQIDYVLTSGYTTDYLTEAKEALRVIFYRNINNAIDAGEMTSMEGEELKDAFKAEYMAPLEQQMKTAVQAMKARMEKYGITRMHE